MFELALAGLALLQVVLTVRVIKLRRSGKVALGDAGDPALRRAIRVHANLVETAPLPLILFAVIYIKGWPLAAGLLALLLLAGRCIHASGVSREPETIRYRVTGMILTFASIIGGAGTLLAQLFL
jgi:uncharacterized membrane protein YecN with MAPEG domain